MGARTERGVKVEVEIRFARTHSAVALAQIGGESGEPYLEHLAEDRVPRVAMISGAALALLRGPKSVV